MRRFRLPIAALVVIAIVLGYFAWRWIAWETWSYDKQILLADGSTLDVAVSGEQMRYWGHPHVFGFGGGHPMQLMRFSAGGAACWWKGPFNPIALQIDNGTPVLAALDRETDFPQHVTFRYYRLEGNTWVEHPFKNFPPTLAWQNLWLSHHAGRRSDGTEIDEYAVVAERNPDSWDFQESYTAKMWHCIATGEQYWQVANESIDAKFLREHMSIHSGSIVAQPSASKPKN